MRLLGLNIIIIIIIIIIMFILSHQISGTCNN